MRRKGQERDSEMGGGYKEEGMFIPNKREGCRWEMVIEEVICASGEGSSNKCRWWKPEKRSPNRDFEEKNSKLIETMKLNVKRKKVPFHKGNWESQMKSRDCRGTSPWHLHRQSLKPSGESAQGYLEKFTTLSVLGGHAFPSFLSHSPPVGSAILFSIGS